MKSIAQALANQTNPNRPPGPVPIALVITDLDVGGAERALVALATGLDRSRWQPSVICLDGEGALVHPLRDAGIATTCLGVDRRRPIGAVRSLARALKSDPPALIQSFLFHANIASRLAAPWVGRPWVVGGLRVAERQRRWHLKLDRLTQRLSAGSVCVSEGVRRFSVETGRLDPDRLVVIPNGVDPSPFDETNPIDRESLGLPGSGPLALYVGRLDPQKGLGDLIEAARRVAITRPDWHLLMVGDGPERTQRQEQAATHPELAGRIHWLGRRPDIPALLKTANFLVLPSLWEGMPNVVLEAMAAGRAVVGTRVEGTEELVVPGKTGWLVPPAAPEALAAALLEASTDQDRLRRMGEAARRRVEEHYTPGRVVAAYDRLWAGLLGLSFVGAD